MDLARTDNFRAGWKIGTPVCSVYPRLALASRVSTVTNDGHSILAPFSLLQPANLVAHSFVWHHLERLSLSLYILNIVHALVFDRFDRFNLTFALRASLAFLARVR